MNNLKNNTAPVSLIGISGKMGHGKDTVAKIIQYVISLNDGSLLRHHQNLDNFLNGSMIEIPSEWTIKKFATPIKQIASIMTGISIEKMETQEDKEVMLGEKWTKIDWIVNIANPSMDEPSIKHVKKQSLRELLQRIGDVMLQIHSDWLLNVMFRDYTLTRYQYKDENEGYSTYPNWIISDLRKPNEYNKIKELGGKCIKVVKTLSDKDKEELIVDFHRNSFDDLSLDTEEALRTYCQEHLKGASLETIQNSIALPDFIQWYNDNTDTHISETALDNITDWDYIIEAEHGDIDSLVEQVKEMLIKFEIL
jgi:hypothetical protein